MSRKSKFKLNGIMYTQIDHEDGRREYDPPLPEGKEEQWSRNFQEIVETKTCPGVHTENAFFAGRGTLSEQFKDDPVYLDYIIERARARGYNPSPNDVYFSSVADDDGDPAAFVSQADGVGKLRKVCEERNLACEEIGAERRELPPRPNVRLAEDLVQEQMVKYREDPTYQKVADADLRELVIESHGAPKE